MPAERAPSVLGDATAQHLGDPSVQKRMTMILGHIDLCRARVLDIGCGNGVYTTRMSQLGAHAVGVDVEPIRLGSAREFKRLHGAKDLSFSLASAMSLPFADDAFDVVTMIEVLEHVEDDARALLEVRRVLRDGGKVAIFVPNRLWPFETHGMRLGGKEILFPFIPGLSWAPGFIRNRLEIARVYGREGLVTLLRRSGFESQGVTFMWPAVDQNRMGPLKNARVRSSLRRLSNALEKSPLSSFGLSIFAAAINKKPTS